MDEERVLFLKSEIGNRKLEIILTVSDLRKSFTSPAGDKVEVLRGIELSAAGGELIAITGASGAGKSTFLQLLGGLDQPVHGTIVWNQFSVTGADGSELAQFRLSNIGFVFQFHHLLGDLTALENVALPLLIARISLSKAKARAHQ